MTRFDPLFRQALADLDAESRRRRLRAFVPAGPALLERADRQRLIDFSSNDYLGLSCHPALIERAAEWAGRFGAGSGASRLVTGTRPLHERVEAKFAALKGCEAALLFASGWQANASLVPALARLSMEQAGAMPLVFTDRLNHASLHQGCAAAGVRQIRFRHNDLGHLEALLESRADEPGLRVILTESVFSMDGDRADIPALAALAERYEAFLCLDEAHATGVLGAGGAGLAGGAPWGVHLVMGTFSKALGGMGACIAGSRALCDWLLNTASGFVFSTSLPPSVLGAADAALDLLPELGAERERVARHGERLRTLLAEAGFSTGASSTQIVPVMIGGAEEAMEAARKLEAEGFLTAAIRPPTVPRGESRLRVTLSAAHDEEMVEHLVDAIIRQCGPG
ncbi:aminotransferase class I/II-fold pyridoxal phosphate-dependent enzyme [Acetobacter oeni]|uniref:8-amino-7-oxononanoate synthase n=1 Tax=Acetobacter oeni TaxID=304077 RepID=A0A511XM05_9PROT|nr:aminotransferase class I/II-fold pyridoxal phosphate-dependent enzyme [Acetobacter oeni]NHO20040.1 aminotransferase class I/II-fold pyridoxal phosphate-dependent enzyme [Acetobacter oeni]GBR03837.1 8-amino-7-oxononanoate synthase [Acetobacter oeni LMG 21952]GEN63971.1 8-amino-7-ketopelargonate synthase [Acetobacter oeni]